MTLYPLTSVGADSLWDYNSMDTTGSEMAERYVYEGQPEVSDAANTTQKETRREKRIRLKKEKQARRKNGKIRRL